MTRTIAVEVDSSADGLRVVDYAAAEAVRTGAELLLVAPYHVATAYSPMTPFRAPRPPREQAAANLREAAARVRHQFGHRAPAVRTARQEGARQHVLQRVSRSADLLVIGRAPARGPHRLISSHRDLALAARSGCPVLVVPGRWRPSAADQSVYVDADDSPEALGFAFHTAAAREATVFVVGDTDLTRAPALDAAVACYPDVRVRITNSPEPLAESLARSSVTAGLVVIGVVDDARVAASDPVVRHALAAATCPLAVVRGRLPAAARRRRRSMAGELILPTY